MPKSRQPRRPQVGTRGHQLSTEGTNGSNGSRTGGLSAADAELILAVLRELKKGDFSVRMPLSANGLMARIGAELNGIIELNERNAKNLSGVATIEANIRTEELLKQSQILFAEAQEASKSKSAFLSMAAHELRTPLSVITGYLSMLQDGSIPPDKAERPLRVLMGKATELNSIVDDLLTAARIEGGTVPTDTKTLDLRQMARQAIGRAEARAGLLRAEMDHSEPDDPVAVDADREQLARIIDNLLNNALTYSTGRPWVMLTVTTEDGPALIIEDHGVGVPREKQDKIFERFFRIDDPGLGPQPGTGLGLFISRELAERHGGSLTLERSELGHGSTFILRLPPASGVHAATLLSVAPALDSVPAS
ncbi:MAG TPA: HAMP domain-containing sensor histidine kinase [Candidatus Dormibacteraeota bacterium]|nr:HAMP domain-containing sensor histidine kinase [Candidatus Dormibacteraeota bacterium]